MQVDKILCNQYINPKTTGYAAAASLGAAVLSGISKNKAARKQHKPLAYLTAVLTTAHIGLTEYYHSRRKG